MLENEKLEILSIQSCDRLYRLMMPIARQRQRSSSKLARIGSLAMNAMLAPWPYGVLSVADKMLGVFGLRETQCYALARRNG
jgi:hypothetical protein